jgi:hypothetical protein
MSIVSDELNFKHATAAHGTYQWQKIYPQEGQQNYPVTASQGPTNTFQLPANVMNLGKSDLVFTFQTATQGAGNYSWINVNGSQFIQQINLSTRSGTQILQLNDVDRYLNLTLRKESKLEDVLTWDTVSPYTAAGAGTSFFEGLSPSNATLSNSVRLDNTAMVKPGMECEYVVAGAANSATYVDCKIGMDKIHDTILALNRDTYWRGEILVLQVLFNNLNNICYLGTSGTNPTTGAAVATGAAQIMNPYFYLAVEVDPAIQQAIITKFSSAEGASFKTGYVYRNSLSLPQGGNNLQITYNSGQGSHIKKIYWGVYTTGAATNFVYDHSNLANARITSFQTLINTKPIQNFLFSPAAGDDWILYRNKTRSRDILSFNEYLYNWCYCDDFTSDRSILNTVYPDIPTGNIVDGIPLMHGEIIYQVNASSAAALTNYVFTIIQREIKVNAEGVSIM